MIVVRTNTDEADAREVPVRRTATFADMAAAMHRL